MNEFGWYGEMWRIQRPRLMTKSGFGVGVARVEAAVDSLGDAARAAREWFYSEACASRTAKQARCSHVPGAPRQGTPNESIGATWTNDDSCNHWGSWR